MRSSRGCWLALLFAALVVSPSRAAESVLRAGSGPAVPRMGIEGLDPGARRTTPDAPKPEAPAPSKPAARTRFRIAHIRFETQSGLALAIPLDELEDISRNYENRMVSLMDLRQLTVDVRKLYQSKGYLLASAAIPPQRLKAGGDVKVKITQGRYGRLKIEGNKYYSEEFIARFFEPAMRDGFVKDRSLQRSLLVLNEISDLSVRSLFVAGAKPGTSDVVLRAHDRRPFHYGIDYNNYGNPLVGRNRGGLALWLGSLFQFGDEMTLRYTVPFPSTSDPLYQAGYMMPVGDRGDRLSYSFASAATSVGGDLAILDIRGDAKIHAISWAHPLVRSLHLTTNLSTSVVIKSVRNFVVNNNLVSKDELRLLTAGYDSNSVGESSRTLTSVLYTQGLGTILHGNRTGDPLSSRVGSGNEFVKLNTEVFHIIELAKGKYLLGRFSGQLSSNPMTVSEQFALGGPDSVRGYIQSEFLSDDGYSASVEYRQLVFSSKDRFANVQVAAFADHGDGSLQLPQVGERASRSLTGVGVGIRGSFGRATSLRLDLGFPLADQNQLQKNRVLYAQMVSRW